MGAPMKTRLPRWAVSVLVYVAGLVALVAVCAYFMAFAALHRTDILQRSPENCARKMGISYTIVDGPSERPEEFLRCTEGKR